MLVGCFQKMRFSINFHDIHFRKSQKLRSWYFPSSPQSRVWYLKGRTRFKNVVPIVATNLLFHDFLNESVVTFFLRHQHLKTFLNDNLDFLYHDLSQSIKIEGIDSIDISFLLMFASDRNIPSMFWEWFVWSLELFFHRNYRSISSHHDHTREIYTWSARFFCVFFSLLPAMESELSRTRIRPMDNDLYCSSKPYLSVFTSYFPFNMASIEFFLDVPEYPIEFFLKAVH